MILKLKTRPQLLICTGIAWTVIAHADCSATVDLVSVSVESAKFRLSVPNCHNSNGSYDFTVHYKEKGTGKVAQKTWSRPWGHVGDGPFEVTEYPSKSSDEIIDDVTDARVQRCVCLDN